MNDINLSILGDTRGEQPLSSREDNIDVALALAAQARRNLRLITPNLEPELYDTAPFVEAVQALALHSPHTFIHVLVQDTERVIKTGHRLIELARRLTSNIAIQVPGREHKEFGSTLLIADEVGFLRRNLADRYHGIADFNAPRIARDMARQFDEMWEKSAPDPNLRRLFI